MQVGTQHVVFKGQRLRDVRKGAGLSQQRLADMVGVSRESVKSWERDGIEHATLGNAVKVAEALGVSVYDLIDADERKTVRT